MLWVHGAAWGIAIVTRMKLKYFCIVLRIIPYAVNVGFESLAQKALLIHFMTRNSNDSFALRSLLSSPNNYLVLV